jgi:CheY-like chemotaxis protein/anti-sigma regulatory factor (Ser/Thr protein kinase)
VTEREDELAEEVAALRARLVQAERLAAVGRLAAGVAHDFNNLLTVINGYAHLLLERVDNDECRAEVQEIQRAGERAAVHTRQILSFARRRAVGPEDVDLTRLIEGPSDLLASVLGEHVRLTVRVPPEPVVVRGDAAELELVLANLATNAREAMPGGGELRIELSREDGRARLVVRDDGHGMDEETLARCLEPGFTTGDSERSAGLGLATVREIAEAACGSVEVESEPGKGTTVRVDLPLAESPSPAAEPPLPVVGGTVLVVEDEGTLRALLDRCLTTAGFDVLSAADADAALEITDERNGEIDLLLTDIVLPRSDGRDLARRLRELRPGLAVLFMSGYADAVIPAEGAAEVAGQLLRKPFTPTALVARVREALAVDR